MWIQISSGKGPDECELAVSLFFKAYEKECSQSGMEVKVLDAVPGSITGNYKSILLSIDRQNTDKLVSGTIQWICKSPYRPNHKRKNWFINLEVFEEPEMLIFSDKEIKFEAMRSSGPGGQNVNKVETAVRAIHLPTGLTVSASEERSQHMNKKLALARLMNMLNAQNEQNSKSIEKDMWMQHNLLIRGNPIRTYEGEKFKLKTFNS
ncbi:MAG: peptide chain release factor H [Clostridiaceae bacterium]|mgnify:CR=1 FL=1|jgi:peptide chain release factor|nr:peptide chain release factor H [Clostridiaceae bacterium]